MNIPLKNPADKSLKHSEVVENIEEIIDILKKPISDKNSSLETEKLISFIRWFLLKKNKFLVYVGAGGSKDINVLVEGNNPSKQKAKTHNWQDLLKAVYGEIKDKKEFLKVASARVGALDCLAKEKKKKDNFIDGKTKPKGVSIEDLTDDVWKNEIFGKYGDKILQEVLNKLGPFNFAWCLRWFAGGKDQLETPVERDRILSKIVNETITDTGKFQLKDVNKPTFKSALLEEIIKLPSREIITTNYDHYLDLFLTKKEKSNFFSIYNTETLIQSFQKFETQLYYLHGKAGESDNLVLDKYDYAQLFAKNRQLLDHLVRLFLRYGILYVGFGLDDQTFSYMGSQMRILCSEGIKGDKKEVEQKIKDFIPLSYAFMRKAEISNNEINALAELYNIEVIKFQDFPDIPEVLTRVNNVFTYVKDRKIDWLKDEEQISEIQELVKSAADKFLEAKLKGCLEDYRKALAHTLFWTVETEQDGEKQWKKIQIICEIRRNLTLTRSKLRWTNNWDEENETYHIKDNFDRTKEILGDFEREFRFFLMRPSDKVNSVKEALVVEQTALKMLEARVDYQKGSFKQAVNEFEKFTLENKDNTEYKASLDIVRRAVRTGRNQKLKKHEIRLLETYYFAQCQFDRTYNVFSNNPDQRITENLVEEIESIHKKQWIFFEDKEEKEIKEEVLLLREFGTIVVIAIWGLAFGKLRDFSSFTDISTQNKRKSNLEKLENINNLLEKGWDYAKCLNDYDNNDDKKNKIKKCLPSPRWETVKHRSRARALALIWFNDRTRTDALTDSYKSIQKALDITSNKASNKDALEIQHIRNLLEAVRLNTLTNFSEVYLVGAKDSSMCFAASYHYLRSAFKILEQLLQGLPKKENPYIWWILIQAYETACFWRLVFNSFVKSVSNDKIQLLNDFMNISDSEVEKYVVGEYKKFGNKILKDSSKVEGRIKSFKKVLKTVIDQKNLSKSKKSEK